MIEKAEEWMRKIEWMSRVNVDRGRLIWELLARPAIEHAAEVWWIRGKVVRRKLEAVQERVGRRLLMSGPTVAGVAVRGEFGWWSLEERRQRKKLLFGRRFGEMDDSRLVKRMMRCLVEAGGVGWWEEFEAVLDKFGIY